MPLAGCRVDHKDRRIGIVVLREVRDRHCALDASVVFDCDTGHVGHDHLARREAVVAVPLGRIDRLAGRVARHGQRIEIDALVGSALRRRLRAARRRGHRKVIAREREQAVRRIEHVAAARLRFERGARQRRVELGRRVGSAGTERAAGVFRQSALHADVVERCFRIEQRAELLGAATRAALAGVSALDVINALADVVEDAGLGQRVLAGGDGRRQILRAILVEQAVVAFDAQQRRGQRAERHVFLIARERRDQAGLARRVDVVELLLRQDVAERVLGQSQQHHVLVGRQAADVLAEGVGGLAGDGDDLQAGRGAADGDARHQRARRRRDLRQVDHLRLDQRADARDLLRRQHQEIVIAVEGSQHSERDERRIGDGQCHFDVARRHGRRQFARGEFERGIGHALAAAADVAVVEILRGRRAAGPAAGARSVGDWPVVVQRHAARAGDRIFQPVHRALDIVGVRDPRVFVDAGRVRVVLQQAAHRRAVVSDGLHQRQRAVGIGVHVIARTAVIVEVLGAALLHREMRGAQTGERF